MHILMFGATGQVAREVIAQAGEMAAGKIRLTALPRAAADLADPEACAALIRATPADIVLNAAAWTAVDRAEEAEADATLINGAAPAAMARAAAETGRPFLHLSTEYVFDGKSENPYPPDAATAPLSAYGRSKLAGEDGVREAGGAHVILRTSWVFSASGANFVTAMLRLSESRDRLRVVADQHGGPTPARDLAAACLTIARAFHAGRGVSGTYHLSGAPDTNWADFAREIFARAGRSVAVEDIPASDWPAAAPRPLNSRLDCTALARDYGIARPDWRAGLDTVLKELS